MVRYLFFVLLFAVSGAQAVTREECLAAAAVAVSETTTAAEIRAMCDENTADASAQADTSASAQSDIQPAATPQASQSRSAKPATEQTPVAADEAGPQPVAARLTLEKHSHKNPFVLTPYKPNYAVYSYVFDTPTPGFSEDANTQDASVDNSEVEFQLSLQYILFDNLFKDRAMFSFAFTVHSFWQAFNRQMSSPFRETVYEPEVMLTFKNDWKILGFTNVLNGIAINHQSNGRSEPLSRSWNRIMAHFVFEKGNYVTTFSPWYRLPESDKKDPLSPNGDDNPDISHYLGYFDWQNIYKYKDSTFKVLLRNNLDFEDNKNTFELTYSRPLNGRLRLYVKYFQGYGRDLIDYNVNQKAFSIGLALNDWL